MDDEGMFSFLNFSFLKNKKKVEEFARKPDEPQENFLDRMTVWRKKATLTPV